jgi:low temperature requirement protein LtrA
LITPDPVDSGPDRSGAGRRDSTTGWLRAMVPRSTDEGHRASTPLELLFDLCFVVAVSQAAAQLEHGITAGHIGSSVVGYLMVFFAIWWAWVNFTWFASAYDIDDVAYRLLTFVQIVGALVLAAGVASAFSSGDFATITVGYVVMRVAMVAQWLRAAASDPEGRSVAHRYALGITLLQIGWVVRLFLPHSWGDLTFCLLAAGEMAVPWWAERRRSTAWHPGHINERYGLFTLIVLGESVAAATIAIQQAVSSDSISASLVGLAVGGLALVFGLWWWYFEHSAEEALRISRSRAYVWGYAHYFIFGAVAAFGTGLEVAVDTVEHHGRSSTITAALAVAIPVAIFLAVTAALHAAFYRDWPLRRWYPPLAVAALMVLAFSAGSINLGVVVPLMALVVAGLVVTEGLAWRRVVPTA